MHDKHDREGPRTYTSDGAAGDKTTACSLLCEIASQDVRAQRKTYPDQASIRIALGNMQHGDTDIISVASGIELWAGEGNACAYKNNFT